ncbi:MAG: sodium-translocating pyrophosphatase [Candidatus Kariarchaeum pelagius]
MTFSFGVWFWAAPITGVIGLIFAYLQYKDVISLDRGTEKAIEVQDAIMEGSKAFINRQTKTIAIIGAVITVLIYLAIDLTTYDGAPFSAIAFVLGATSSVVAGFIAMIMAAETNARTTHAATISRSEALRTAYKGGLVLGLSVVSFSIIGISLLFLGYSIGDAVPSPSSIIAFGFGASFAALFAQLGGGIFTKSADVGADLVGKIEAGIPEDDPRNPGVIADNVGDAVGDCAGRGADLFESISGETIGAMIVGLIFYLATVEAGLEEGYAIGFIIFPLVARGLSMLATLVTLPIVKLDDSGMKTEKDEQGNEIISFDDNPMRPMNNAFYAVSAISFVVFAILILFMLGNGDFAVFWPLIASAAVGIVLALLTLWVTDYYTGDNKPVLSIAESSLTGPATNIITGLSVGLMSTWAPMLSLIGAIVISYILGIQIPEMSGNEVVDAVNVYVADVEYLPGDDATSKAKAVWGIFSTTIATMSMLSVTPMILTMDGYGPIADQSGGIAEMSGAGEDVRAKIDSLDMVGNTTKALAKGYGMTSAGLAALLLFQAYLEDLHKAAAENPNAIEIGYAVDLINPGILAGLFVGALLPFVFTAFSMMAVGNAAGKMIDEIRRQFREDGDAIMNFEKKPDYAACVDVATNAALREMIVPSLLVVITPILVGFVFGALPLAAFLIGATVAGILLGLTLNNAGGAWDNAKKVIETGKYGGKGSEAHAAAVIGDTVGDPTKDTSGPSIHVLIKLVNTIAITLVPVLVVVQPLIGF